MYQLYEIRDWIYECERFLFLAEVHFIDEKVSPLCHNFCHVLTGNKLREMLDVLSEQQYSYLNVHSCVTPKELDLFKCIVDSVSSERWHELCTEKIMEAQNILHKLACGLENDIMRVYKEKGYPLLCSEAELYL